MSIQEGNLDITKKEPTIVPFEKFDRKWIGEDLLTRGSKVEIVEVFGKSKDGTKIAVRFMDSHCEFFTFKRALKKLTFINGKAFGKYIRN